MFSGVSHKRKDDTTTSLGLSKRYNLLLGGRGLYLFIQTISLLNFFSNQLKIYNMINKQKRFNIKQAEINRLLELVEGNDMQDWVHHFHGCQNVLISRVVRRDYPNVFN